jgi:hypothetical protein
MHLAIGGFTTSEGSLDPVDPFGFVSDSNGDMGENETAGFLLPSLLD